MIPFLLIGVVLVTIGGLVAIARKRDTPAELGRNWWAGFERDFYAYVCRTRRAPSEDGARQDQGD